MKKLSTLGCLALCFYLTLPSLYAQWKIVKPQPIVADFWNRGLVVSPYNTNVAWGSGINLRPGSFAFQEGAAVAFKTENGGESWSPVNFARFISVGELGRFSFADDKTIWISGVDKDGVISLLRSENGGVDWTNLAGTTFKNNGSYVNGLHFWDKQTGFAWGDPAPAAGSTGAFFEIYHTTDGGTTWTRLPKDSLPAPVANEIGLTALFEVNGDYVGFQTVNGTNGAPLRYLYSFNQGRSWRVSATPLNNSRPPSFADAQYGIAAGPSRGLLLLTKDGGATWERLPIQDATIYAYSMIPGSRHIIAIMAPNLLGNFRTMVSTDLGQTWKQIGETASVGPVVLSFISPSVGYGLGVHNWQANEPLSGYRYTGSPLTGLFSGTALQADIQISPNPATDRLRVQIDLENANPCVVLLHDLQGRLLERQELSQNAQQHVAFFDVQALPAGVYSVMISTKEGYVVRQVVK